VCGEFANLEAIVLCVYENNIKLIGSKRMAEEEIKVGDVVMLKSGGPEMTVEDIGDYRGSGGPSNGAKCTWFVEGEKKTEVFAIEALMKVESEPIIDSPEKSSSQRVT